MINSLSIIFPIFNESQRLHFAIQDIKKFNKKNKIKKLEYIFVDDGSKDNSREILGIFIKRNKKRNINYKVLKIKNNRGKGNALKNGVKFCNNDWILTLDSDISVSISQINNWRKKNFLNKKNTIFFGSRNLHDSKMKYKLYRKILGVFFSFFIKFLFSINLKDTQCGFKLYRKKEAKLIFKNLKDKGFAHDIELILLAKKNNISISELPVNWTHRDNSKLNIFFDTFNMFYNLIKIKINYN
jgi:dolichyl-phosphate beta-glucosyltransferase